jgi:hypothetical protein
MRWSHRAGDRVAVWATKHLPATFVARPFEWVIVIILVNSGTTILLGKSNPPSLENVLKNHGWAVFYYGWGITLLLGALAMGWGLSSIRWVKSPVVYTMEKVLQYQLGMRLLALASFVFAGAILINSPLNGLPAASVTAMFGVMCLTRLISLRSNL